MYVARIPLLGVERRALVSPALGEDCEAPCLAFEELAAGKYVALLSRAAARDFFDAASVLKMAPDLNDRPGFRLAFICQAAASCVDFRRLEEIPRVPDRVEVRQKLVPLLRIDLSAPPPDPAVLAEDMSRRLGPTLRRMLRWTKGEREFLDRFLERAEIEPELLTGDAQLQERIRKQPMLLWKQRTLRAWNPSRQE
jgi:hypothetical protein